MTLELMQRIVVVLNELGVVLHLRSYGSTQYDKRHLVNDRPYHGSAESLLIDDPVADVRDVEGCFRSQCSQVFIGMITMQYQAKQV